MLRRSARTLLLAAALVPVAACASSADSPYEQGGGSGGGSGAAGASGAGGEGAGPAGLPLAAGVAIKGVTLYQGVSIPLVLDGNEITDRRAPVVSERPALFRVFVEPQEGWQQRTINAVIELELPDKKKLPAASAPLEVAGASEESSIGSTINVEVPAESMKTDVSWSVSLREVAADVSAPGSTAGAAWATDGKKPLGAQSSNGPLRLVFVPYAYGGDGSGRLPDTSDDQMQKYKDRFYGTYPTPTPTIDLHEPVPFNQTFSPTGQGWQALLQTTCSLRQQDKPDRNVYYHGIIMPGTSFGKWCGGGCIAGLGVVTNNPNDNFGRCSIGLGFPGYESADTALHEVAHALGRYHAPCGGAQGVDKNFPYSGASVGVWGYDIGPRQLKDPGLFKDFMGYCAPRWISDYTYNGIFGRIAYVNASPMEIVPAGYDPRWRIAILDGEGGAQWGSDVDLPTPPHGDRRTVRAIARAGDVATEQAAHFYPFDHLPGGMALVPRPDPSLVRAVEFGAGAVLDVAP